MRKTKKALASLAIAGMVLSMAPMSVFGATTTTTTRLAGSDRIATAIAVAGQGWTNSDNVIVVPADDANIVDALAAAPLAGQLNAPILVTYKGALDAQVQQKIIDLKAKNVYAVGALSTDAVNSLKAISGVTVTTLQGADRTETAALVAAQLTNVKGSFVVAYNGTADALSAASFAAANGYSVVVANPDGSIPASEAAYKVAPTYTVGGQVSVAGATALYGADRYATNDAVVNGLTYTYDKVYVANGETLVDALAGAPLAAQTKSPIVLADATHAAKGVNDNLTAGSQVIALGGTGAVSQNVLGQVAYQSPDKVAVTSLTAPNARQIQVVFNQPVDKDTVITSDDTPVAGLFEVTRIPAGNDADKTFEAADVNAMDASLSDDGMTLTLTVKNPTDDTNPKYLDGTYTVYVNSGITNTAGEDLGEYTTTISVDDQTAPTVSSISYNSATNNIEVKYSEPIDGAPSVTIDGKNYTGTASSKANKFTYAVSDTSLERGETAEVTASGGVDFLGNEQENSTTKSVTIEMNESDLAVTSVTQKNSNTIRVVFDKTVEGDATEAATAVGDALTMLSNGKTVDSADYTVTRNDDDDSDHRTFDIAFDGTAPDYDTLYNNSEDTAKVTMIFGDGEITDVFGNTNTEINESVTMNKVTAAPVLVSAKEGANSDTLEVRFDKTVSLSDAGITVRKDGYVSDLFDAAEISSSSDKVVVLHYTSGDISNGTYTIHFDKNAVVDENGNENKAFSTTVTVADADSTSNTVTVATTGTNKYEVSYFNADGTTLKVGDSAVDAASYTLNGNALPSGTDLYFASSDKDVVVIELPDASVNYSDAAATLRDARVYDADGNKVTAKSLAVEVTDNIKPTLVSATLSGNIMTMTFDEAIDEQETSIATLADLATVFEIKGGSSTILSNDSDAITASVDGKKLTLVLSGGNWSTVKAYSKITVKTLEYDNALLLGDGVNVLDDGTTVTVSK